MSGAGALYGKLIAHVAALASTCRETVAYSQDDVAMRQAATYRRAGERVPYRVIHDTTVNRPYGRFAVYIGERRIGAQLSFPSADDCRRMEHPPALSAPYEERLSKSARIALGVMTTSEKVQRAAAHAAYYAKQKKLAQQKREKKGGET